MFIPATVIASLSIDKCVQKQKAQVLTHEPNRHITLNKLDPCVSLVKIFDMMNVMDPCKCNSFYGFARFRFCITTVSVFCSLGLFVAAAASVGTHLA